MTISKSYHNVFEALEDNPTMAQNLKIRSELMIALRQYIRDAGLGQKEAAEMFGVHQPRISDLMRGKIDKFTIDRLVNMLTRAGENVKIDLARLPQGTEAINFLAKPSCLSVNEQMERTPEPIRRQ